MPGDEARENAPRFADQSNDDSSSTRVKGSKREQQTSSARFARIASKTHKPRVANFRLHDYRAVRRLHNFSAKSLLLFLRAARKVWWSAKAPLDGRYRYYLYTCPQWPGGPTPAVFA